MDRKVKVRVKGLCGSNEPSRAAIPPSPSGVEFERMEKDARALHGLEWSESSTWLAGGCGMAWFSFSFALTPIFRVASCTFLKFVLGFSSMAFKWIFVRSRHSIIGITCVYHPPRILFDWLRLYPSRTYNFVPRACHSPALKPNLPSPFSP